MRVDYQADETYKERLEAESDALWKKAKELTPAQLDQWVEDNVTDLASAKHVLKAEGKATLVIIRKMMKAGLW